MARAGSKKHRAREAPEAAKALRYMQARDELVSELWELDRALGVRNVILQRLAEHLTPQERRALAGESETP